MDKTHCNGCRDDFYNGNNDLGVSRCWNLDSAKLMWRKEVHINQCPPWTQKAKRLPSCYSRAQFVYVAAGRTN